MKIFKTGLTDFDKFFGGGFVSGSAVTVCGRVGSCKSSLLTHFALQFAEQGANVVFYSASKTRSILHALAAGAWMEKKSIATMNGFTEDELQRIAVFLRAFAGNPGDISFRTLVPPRTLDTIGDVSKADVVIFDVPIETDTLEVLAGEGKLVICARDTSEYGRVDPRPHIRDLPAATVSASDVIIATHSELVFGSDDRKIELIVIKGRDTGVDGCLVAGIRASCGAVFDLTTPVEIAPSPQHQRSTAKEKRKPDSTKQFFGDVVAFFDAAEAASAQTVSTKLKLVTQPDLEP
jgi:hypothetical protein